MPGYVHIVHCDWNEWVIGTCSKSCGGGIRIDTRTESVSAKHGGDKCEGPSSMEVSCNDQECPGKKYMGNVSEINHLICHREYLNEISTLLIYFSELRMGSVELRRMF